MKLYGTFDDNKSVDHGDLGEQILKGKYSPVKLGMSKLQFELLLCGIKNHTKSSDGDSE